MVGGGIKSNIGSNTLNSLGSALILQQNLIF
jgi:hypothetical protein